MVAKCEVFVNGVEKVEGAGNMGGTSGLVRGGREVNAGFGAEMEGDPMEMELLPVRGRGLARPEVTAGALTVEATFGGGVGVVGGVVSIPLSSIIFFFLNQQQTLLAAPAQLFSHVIKLRQA